MRSTYTISKSGLSNQKQFDHESSMDEKQYIIVICINGISIIHLNLLHPRYKTVKTLWLVTGPLADSDIVQ